MKKAFLFLFALILASTFTTKVVLWSEGGGKLAVPPDYDDCITMVCKRKIHANNGSMSARTAN
jgi:hypothetical protein